MAAGGTVVLALMAFGPTRGAVQVLDDGAYRAAVRARAGALTGLGTFLSVAGSTWVLTPVRLFAAVALAASKRWLELTAFLAVAAASQVAVWSLKAAYARPRPSGGLVAASGYAFPSGHALLVTAVSFALVMALTPPERRRAWWIGAVVLSIVMAASRVYLLVHWGSDAVAGMLVGGAVAVGIFVLAEWVSGSPATPDPGAVSRPAVPPAPAVR